MHRDFYVPSSKSDTTLIVTRHTSVNKKRAPSIAAIFTPAFRGYSSGMNSPAKTFIPGLVSVTFRKLSPDQVVQLAAEAGLKSIEWGGDIHVPHGDLAKAAHARKLCEDAGLTISAYGSYYRAWASETNGVSFSAILDTAEALGTKSIRVWAGNLGSGAAPSNLKYAVANDLKRICQLAAERSCSISLEFHGGTLTDTAPAATALIDAVAAPNLTSYWQPPVGLPAEQCLDGLRMVLPHLQNLHVFHWWPDQHYRLPLADGADAWRQYLHLATRPGKPRPQELRPQEPRHASLEFVRADNPEQFRQDAKILLNLLQFAG
jgi:3-dehydroshikimate dehydratase